MSDATRATATFLFTDVEGSTHLLTTYRDSYASILADHHAILREAFSAHGGREVDNQGDSFFVAFTGAKDAVLAAADGQRALASHVWPGGASVRVRMGIHTGEADLTVDRYVGLSVHRAARISALGHGGQVLVSPTTAGLLDDEATLRGASLRSLGEYRLKDIERPIRIFQLDVDGLPSRFPPLKSARRAPSRRRRIGLAALGIPALAAIGVAVLWATREEPPPDVVPNSLVRLDPNTLVPTAVFPIGSGADTVISSGGYLWVVHHVLRDTESAAVRDAGDHTITRVDPSTGQVTVLGGGLSPCGLTADPSGDVWVANCFASGSGRTANVVRIDAASLEFEATWPVPTVDGPIRALVYGGGSLWLSEVFSGEIPPPPYSVTQLDPQTGVPSSIAIEHFGAQLAWSEGYGDLWIAHFDLGTLSQVHAATGENVMTGKVAINPVSPIVDGDTVWVGDWSMPQVVRIPAEGAGEARTVPLPAANIGIHSVVWQVDAGAAAIWAATPRLGAVWKIDPGDDTVTRIPFPYPPGGVAADGDAVWVTVRDD